MLKRILLLWPLLLLWLSMLFDLVLNIGKSLSLDHTPRASDSLPLSPDIAFSWLQVLANGGMIAVISIGFFTLVQLNRAVRTANYLPLSPWQLAGLVVVFSFSLPAWWIWIMAFWDILHGSWVIDFHNIRYLITAILVPYPTWLAVRLLIQNHALRKAVYTAETPPHSDTLH